MQNSAAHIPFDYLQRIRVEAIKLIAFLIFNLNCPWNICCRYQVKSSHCLPEAILQNIRSIVWNERYENKHHFSTIITKTFTMSGGLCIFCIDTKMPYCIRILLRLWIQIICQLKDLFVVLVFLLLMLSLLLLLLLPLLLWMWTNSNLLSNSSNSLDGTCNNYHVKYHRHFVTHFFSLFNPANNETGLNWSRIIVIVLLLKQLNNTKGPEFQWLQWFR